MVSLAVRGKKYLTDMKKRAAREFSSGFMTKEEFDKFCNCQDEMEQIISVSEKRHRKENKNENK